MEDTIAALEVTTMIRARSTYYAERGHLPTYEQVIDWARATHRHTVAGFLQASSDNPAITRLFTTTEKETDHVHGGEHQIT
jgi:hypothetical protein